MNLVKNIKLSFFLGLSLPLLIGVSAIFLSQTDYLASAASVNVTGEVVSTAPVCGNGIIETGETCESNSDCNTGSVCVNCQCQSTGSPCVPTEVICNWGVCESGVQAGVCTNGCGTWSASRQCGVCPGVICSPGQILDENTCTCLPVALCGNGVVDPGEECDDGNNTSGDCCSSQCTIEVLISNVSVNPAINSANVSWTTQCQATQSVLEWGTTTAVNGGVASGLNGQNYSYNITGLNPGTIYFFRITATALGRQTIHNGSFSTAGAVEICNNGLDDDNNGYCDYPGSICTDGSIPGDPACLCTPDFNCTTGQCQSNGKQTVTCIDRRVPTCQPSYTYEQDCNVCENVFCGPGQVLDQNSCTCYTLPNVCGNGICEPPAENPYNCPQDCPVDCLSQWQCGPWQPEECPANGYQFRNCFDLNGCPIPIEPPEVQRSCSGQCVGLTCGVGEQINLEYCLCEKIVPFCGNGVCESGENHQLCPQDCIKPCVPSWTCSSWNECSSGTQTRSCTDLNNCNLNHNRPPEIRSCAASCDVACGTCQQIDLITCSCFNISPCCGNGICESSELVWSCPVDCGLPPEFKTTLTECLDGIDNDGDGLVDYPDDPGCSGPYDRSEASILKTLNKAQEFIQQNILENPQVDVVNQQVVAPVVATAAVASTAASVSLFNLIAYARYLFTQPIFAIFRRRRHKWGVVYNSLTKQIIDLAIVRLYRRDNGQLVQSRVTDKNGRYSFLVSPGKYYLTVTKPGFSFPSSYLNNTKNDVNYLDLYYGTTVEATDKRPTISFNIPIDPIEKLETPRSVMIKFYLRKLQTVVAFSAVPIALAVFAITPTSLTFGMLIFHLLLFVIFQRIAYQRAPKSWGRVYNRQTNKSLGRVITRIYDKQYNKLLETRVTDNSGRYSFLVGNNVYYVTAEKAGFSSYKSSDIDLLNKKKDALIGMDIPLASQQEFVSKDQSSNELPKTDRTPLSNDQKISLDQSSVADQKSTDQIEESNVQQSVDYSVGRPNIFGQPVDLSPSSAVQANKPLNNNESADSPQPVDSADEDKIPPADTPKNIFG